ncbi:hypothetical protein JNJ66_02205 [Candidatus Saccharibacteria bacterium]|nr:hypothetical protein [Candidatus Saccharibacteria bacterium]
MLTDINCTNDGVHTEQWVPGVVGPFIPSLPQSIEPREPGYGCYMYASNGTLYVLSAWRAIESGPQNQVMYRAFGFKERENSNADAYHCNENAAMNSYWQRFYQTSYTRSNVTDCNELR